MCFYLRLARWHSWRRQWHPNPVLLPGKSHGRRSLVGCTPWGCSESGMTEWFHFHALEKEMATHSSVPAWKIPGTEEPGGLPSMGSHRIGHEWSDLAAAAGGTSGKNPTCQWRRHKTWGVRSRVGKIPWRTGWQPTPVFLSGEFHGQRSLAGSSSPQGRKESDMTKEPCLLVS